MSILQSIDDATSDALSFVLSPIRNLIRRGLRVLVGWAQGIFHLVGAAWRDLGLGVLRFTIGLEQAASAGLLVLTHLTRVVIPTLASWAASGLHSLASDLVSTATDLGLRVYHAEETARHDLLLGLGWVRDHLVDPIERRLGQAEHELYGDIRAAATLVLHPTRLLGYLLDAGLADLPALAGTLGSPLARWLKRNGARDVVAFAHELEAVLAAVL